MCGAVPRPARHSWHCAGTAGTSRWGRLAGPDDVCGDVSSPGCSAGPWRGPGARPHGKARGPRPRRLGPRAERTAGQRTGAGRSGEGPRAGRRGRGPGSAARRGCPLPGPSPSALWVVPDVSAAHTTGRRPAGSSLALQSLHWVPDANLGATRGEPPAGSGGQLNVSPSYLSRPHSELCPIACSPAVGGEGWRVRTCELWGWRMKL